MTRELSELGLTDRQLERLKVSRANRWSFELESKAFLVGDERISVSDMQERVQDQRSLCMQQGELDDAQLARVLRGAMAVTATRTLMLPPMYDYLSEVRQDNALQEVLFDSVADAATAAQGALSPWPADRSQFKAMFMPGPHPHLMMSAGLGVNMGIDESLGRIFDNDHFSKKLGAFGEWNVDTPTQRVVLWAMVGHVARRAEQWLGDNS